MSIIVTKWTANVNESIGIAAFLRSEARVHACLAFRNLVLSHSAMRKD
jgi:hypothetical protein